MTRPKITLLEEDNIRQGSGLAAARARGRRLGRPRRNLDASAIAALRDQGRSWRASARELQAGVATARAALARSENPLESDVADASK